MKILNFALLITLLLFSCSLDEKVETSNKTLNSENKTEDYLSKNKISSDGLELICSTDNSYYFIDKPRENVYLYTELKADFYNNKEIKRAPLNLSIVIDRSGSMSGDKIKYAKDAAIFAVKQLNADDYISIVSYGSDVTEVLAPTKVENKQFIIEKISSIYTGGGTFLSGGMIKGFEKVKENYYENYLNRVMLLSDGLANEGIVSIEELSHIVSNWREKEKISLSTFGIGLNFNEDLMTELSEYGSGNYYFINEPEQIASIFENELNGLTSLVAKDVSVNIEYPEKLLELKKVYGYKFKEIPGEIHIDFGDMFSEEKKAIIINFSIKELKEKDINFLTKVDFISTINEEQTEKEILMKTNILASKNEAIVKENLNTFTMQQAVLFESNFAIEKAAKEFDKGEYEQAKKTLLDNKTFIEKGTSSYGFTEELKKVQETNANYEAETEEYESLSIDDQKFIQKSNKSKAYDIRKKK